MDTKKIGEFLKVLRKERGLTQEQLAEILLVSGRTISRWETGTNMPDLSILIKMAEFYNVEVKEILDGERKSENMDKELKETLSKPKSCVISTQIVKRLVRPVFPETACPVL